MDSTGPVSGVVCTTHAGLPGKCRSAGRGSGHSRAPPLPSSAAAFPKKGSPTPRAGGGEAAAHSGYHRGGLGGPGSLPSPVKLLRFAFPDRKVYGGQHTSRHTLPCPVSTLLCPQEADIRASLLTPDVGADLDMYINRATH